MFICRCLFRSLYTNICVYYTYDTYLWGFPGCSDGKESACNAEDPVNSWVRKIPQRREWLPTPAFLPRKFHGQRNRARKESDITEWLTLNNNKYTWVELPRWPSSKESTCQCRRHKRCRFRLWFGKIPWKRKWQPTPVLLPGESHGQRSLVGYSPWGQKELDTT